MMENKKNPKADHGKNSLLYFMIGLTAVLCMSYTVIEWKTYDEVAIYDPDLINPDILEETPPPIIPKAEPPKPKIKTPPIIEVIDNDDDRVEIFIEPDEPNQDTEVLSVDDIPNEVVIEDPIIIDLLDEAPVFPGCEDATDKKACFQKMMTKHVNRNIRYPDLAQELKIQGRVNTQFIIFKDGTIGGLKLRGPHKSLEDEATRILNKLPKMVPGKQQGKTVKVSFAMPINFVLQ